MARPLDLFREDSIDLRIDDRRDPPFAGDGIRALRIRAAAGSAADPEPGAARERQWVARAVRGEPGAFGQLYRQHVDRVYHYVYFRVRDERLAEDLTQDVFVNALRGVASLRDEEKFVNWLLRIAHNRVSNHWRARAAGPDWAELAAQDADESPPDLAAEDEALSRVERREDAAGLLARVAELTELQRQVIALRFVAGLSVAETAELMQRSDNAVKNLQHHALRALRRGVGAATPGPEIAP